MIEDRLRKLRKEMQKEGIDAFVVTGTDPHMGEYVAPRWRTREFISGFTGSAGTVIVTKDRALLFVDSRYFIQGANEIRGTEYELIKLEVDNNPSYEEWLEMNMKKGDKVGVDSLSISISEFRKLDRRLDLNKIKLVGTEDLLNRFWDERPEVPKTKVKAVRDDYAGFTRRAKINIVRMKLRERGADFTFLSSIDDIAWLTNLRADDIKYNPVFYSYAFISQTRAALFVDESRFTDDMLLVVKEDFEVYSYGDIFSKLSDLTKRGRALYDPDKTAYAFKDYVAKKNSIECINITTELKARKNPAEMDGMRRAHFQDGIAFCNFMANIDPTKEYTEIDISTLFEKEREKTEGYLQPSFSPISAFREDGALCHYSASPESNKKINTQGLLVLDTGSQFEYGTTDLTRTLLFGESASEEEKRDYTLVLKGHLALSRQRFPRGTRGYQLDVLARQFLWNCGMTFYHGTGHGVGCNLNVHEGPMRISTAPIDVPLEVGMVLSDEPGVYKEGRHGIRIENLVAVQEDEQTEFGTFYSFEVLTMVPYEKRLIDTDYLTDNEIEQINLYHKWVRDQLIDYVREDTKAWLEKATSPIEKNKENK